MSINDDGNASAWSLCVHALSKAAFYDVLDKDFAAVITVDAFRRNGVIEGKCCVSLNIDTNSTCCALPVLDYRSSIWEHLYVLLT